MNAMHTIRVWAGCSILVAVCQTASYAGGFGAGGAIHTSGGPGLGVHAGAMQSNFNSQFKLSQPVGPHITNPGLSTVKTNSSPLKTPAGTVKPTGTSATGISFQSKVSTKVGPIVNTTPTKNSGGITFKDKASAKIGPIGTGTPSKPPAPGTGSKPGSGSGASKVKHDHDGFPFWLWFSPAFYGNGFGGWGYGSGYGGAYAAAPVYNDIVISNPVPADQPASAAPSQSASASTSHQRITLKLGQSYTIANDNFGENAGRLSLQLNGLTLPLRVDDWSSEQVSFTLPSLGLAQASEGVFQIAKADHSLARTADVTVIAADAAQ
ncbi:MAG TPA: hypothetical protein VKU82_16020 [Planctomycetaceae bacterium]|nr:hypothetical protein [Planctomycetaceae bacterium]